MQAWRWITAAQVITKKPCKLLGLMVTPSATNAEVKVYDGENTTDPLILEVFLATKDSKEYNFPGGVKTDRGLYIASFTNITGVLVRWEVD